MNGRVTRKARPFYLTWKVRRLPESRSADLEVNSVEHGQFEIKAKIIFKINGWILFQHAIVKHKTLVTNPISPWTTVNIVRTNYFGSKL